MIFESNIYSYGCVFNAGENHTVGGDKMTPIMAILLKIFMINELSV